MSKIIGITGWKDVGKTYYASLIIKLLVRKGYQVGSIKHAHHDFDVDKIGKDSYEIRKSGAENMLISSANRWALMHENTNNSELSLNDLINVLDPLDCDIILVEGFKAEKLPKIQLYREEIGNALLHTSDESIIAIATDSKIETSKDIEVLDINNPQEIAD